MVASRYCPAPGQPCLALCVRQRGVVSAICRICHFSSCYCNRIEFKATEATSAKSFRPMPEHLFPFCQPGTSSTANAPAQPGRPVPGNSPYEIAMKTDVNCAVLCVSSADSTNEEPETQPARLEKATQDGYAHNWVIDTLNYWVPIRDSSTSPLVLGQRKHSKSSSSGVPFGYVEPESNQAFVFNHMRFEMYYRQIGDDSYAIESALITPLSIPHESNSTHPICTAASENKSLSHGQIASGNITFTYDVQWREVKPQPANLSAFNFCIAILGLVALCCYKSSKRCREMLRHRKQPEYKRVELSASKEEEHDRAKPQISFV